MDKQQIILVTGATTGIGRETALHLARLGHRIFATGRKAAALGELEAEARKQNLPLESFLLDVNDEASIRAAGEEVTRRTEGHGLDVLVNNAGFGLLAPMELITDADLRGQLETNVVGLVKVTQQFLPAMRERRAGKIINVSSMVGRMTLPLQGIYCATKHAVESLTDALRMEVAAFGVRVTLVEPGAIKSQFGSTALSTTSKYRDMGSPYGPAIDTYQAVVEKQYRGSPGPECIARTIARIVRKRRPAARYVSPRIMTIALWLVGLVPTRLLDFVMGRVMGLGPKMLTARQESQENKTE
ncbi:MAG: SDR family oxidoreductase [Polyangia bacterium]|jgi:NAD(P)-dependent dehydrogenase (short-subunit alcohol dehydrogenase family)|nr:SDR family oxidoreductase [Polyangia bacterium]